MLLVIWNFYWWLIYWFFVGCLRKDISKSELLLFGVYINFNSVFGEFLKMSYDYIKVFKILRKLFWLYVMF